jgi:hypothetical protein
VFVITENSGILDHCSWVDHGGDATANGGYHCRTRGNRCRNDIRNVQSLGSVSTGGDRRSEGW